jgi:hypothetical protein
MISHFCPLHPHPARGAIFSVILHFRIHPPHNFPDDARRRRADRQKLFLI